MTQQRPTIREQILEIVDAAKDKRGVSMTALSRAVVGNDSLVRRTVDRLITQKVLIEDRRRESFGETRWIRRSEASE